MNTAALWGFIAGTVAWYAPVVVCYFAWPILRRRRAYLVAAAILCLTPNFIDLFAIWPLVLTIPKYVLLLPESLEIIFDLTLPIGAFVGVMAWLLAMRFVPRNQHQTPGASNRKNRATRRSPTVQDAADEPHSSKPRRNKRYGWLLPLVARTSDLLLLLIAVMAYIRFWYIVFRVSPLV